MTKLEQTIDENLGYIRELIENDEGEGEEGVLWSFYREVIAEICKDYAVEMLTDVQRMIQGNDLDGIYEYIKKLKQELQ